MPAACDVAVRRSRANSVLGSETFYSRKKGPQNDKAALQVVQKLGTVLVAADKI